MSMANPTVDWERVGDRYYRRLKLYENVFDEELDLENYTIAGAPYGGALALYRDEDKLRAYRGGQSQKLSIDTYSCSGSLIRRINWEKGPIRGLGWSEDEKLIVVTSDGTVRCYYELQGDFTQFTLGHGAETSGIKACRFWNSGFVALREDGALIAVSNYNDPRPKLLARPPQEQAIHSWALIAPAHSLSRSVEVLLAIEKTIYVVDSSSSEDRVLQNGPFQHISVSPNGKFVALYTDDGKVWVVSSDFQNKLSEYDSKARTVPKDVQWCGNNSVALAWEDEVHMVGPGGAAMKTFYNGRVHILPDIDGLRLISNDVCEFLQKVPEATEEVFKIGSTAPSSVLLDAADQLEKKSPKADDNIQLIRSNLDDAVDICIRAAGQEYSVHWQRQLLKAASFGKSVLDLYNSDEFVNMCETLRILNAVRDYRIGLPLTYDQYVRLTPAKLVSRLISRREYLLALRVSEYLRLPAGRIYVHWASQKARVSDSDEDTICKTVVDKLADKKGISFEVIARAAYDEGRGHLATQLLNYEPRAGKQVPLLLAMEEDDIALDKAIESGDTDLIVFVLLQLKSKLPLAAFFRILSSRPLAFALVESSAASNDTALLKDLYYQDDRPLESSAIVFREALGQPSIPQAIDKLRSAHKILADSKDPAAVQHQKWIVETQHLLKVQEAIAHDLDVPCSGMSLHETIDALIKSGHGKRAQKLQSDFHVSDKTYAWLRLRALVAARAWGELEELSKSRKSPIGWLPYFNEVLGAGNTRLAGAFVAKNTNLSHQERSEMWMKCGMVVDAGKELAKAKDVNGLELLKSQTSDRVTQIELERLLAQFRPRR